MKNYLFPEVFRLFGWALFVPSIILGVLLYNGVSLFPGVWETVLIDFAIIGIALGGLFIVCSKSPQEDEMTGMVRLSALMKSLYVYVGLVVVGTLLINGIYFWLFTLAGLVAFPVIYVLTFSIEMYRYNKLAEDEEQD